MRGGISELCNIVKRLPTMQTNLFEVPDFSTKNRLHHKASKMKKAPQRELFQAVVARLTGLEPATPGVTGRYSNQLSYNRA